MFGSLDDPRAIPEVVTTFLDTHFAGAEPDVIRGRLDGLLGRYFQMRGKEMANEPATEPEVQKVYVAADGQEFSTADELQAHLAAQSESEPEPETPAEPDDEKRQSQITALCKLCGCEEKASEFFATGMTRAEVQAYFKDAGTLASANPVIGGDASGDKVKSPEDAYKAEFAEQKELHAKLGTTEEKYVEQRMIEDGHKPQPVLMPIG
jgi:hypothetical protein